MLHSGTHERGLGAQQRHGLTLHVGAHESAVGVVVLEERNERRRDGHELLRRDVDVVDIFLPRHDDVALATRRDAFVEDGAVFAEADVGLGDGVAVLFPCREVEAVRLDLGGLLLPLDESRVLALELVLLDDLSHLVGAVAGVEDDVVVPNAAFLHLSVRALDEPELVDAGEAREARDEPDVRTFGRLDGADAAVVGRVDVAHLEPGALAGEATRPEGREPTLVGDLGQRVRLVHELRELARAEELADAGHDGLGVDEVVRHGRGHLLVDAHLLLDGPLHPDETDAELVLEQLAHAADTAIAEVVDVVDVLGRTLEAQHLRDDGLDVLELQDLLGESECSGPAWC